MKSKKLLLVKKYLLLIFFIFTSTIYAGEPCCYLLICCKNCNRGVEYLVNGQWKASHDYSDINQTRDILQKIKEVGIKNVIIDMSNSAQWESLWVENEKAVNNIEIVCKEKKMKFFILIGSSLTQNDLNAYGNVNIQDFWNEKAGVILDKWAKKATYKKFGYDGDNRPMIVYFDSSERFKSTYNATASQFKTNLSKFYIGNTQVNEYITAGTTDGWGYRNFSQNSDGSIRFASSNGGVAPENGTPAPNNFSWHKVSPAEFKRRTQWAAQASKYSIYGAYDDTCDAIDFGIAKTDNAERNYNKYPNNDPYVYYNIVKEIVANRGSKNYINPVVQLEKRNASRYALDGGNGATENQKVILYTSNPGNVNQQWIEILRGDGYYSYQKVNTNYCMDGGNGGTPNQNMILWPCQENNHNQQWSKINTVAGYYRLQKRNAQDFAIDGGNGGADNNQVILWYTSPGNLNQEWKFNVISSSRESNDDSDNLQTYNDKDLNLYPNPVDEILNIDFSNKDVRSSSIKIYDFSGRIIQTVSKIYENNSIDIRNLKRGVYFIQIEIGTEVFIRKIIKN
jgi:hypothetical protein